MFDENRIVGPFSMLNNNSGNNSNNNEDNLFVGSSRTLCNNFYASASESPIGGASVGSVGGSGLLPVSAFSAFHLLRNYNYFIGPHQFHNAEKLSSKSSPEMPPMSRFFKSPHRNPLNPKSILTAANLPSSYGLHKTLVPFPLAISPHPHPNTPQRNPRILPFAADTFGCQKSTMHAASFPERVSPTLTTVAYLSNGAKRQRGEKKPIPEDQKDEKYFERRRRNNHAAKKSRDARKIREDRVALRATLLEHENAILKSQILSLREEVLSLKQMLTQKS